MKFGYISGDNLRDGNTPEPPKSITYTEGSHVGETHTVIPEKVILNCHGLAYHQRINGLLEQIYFKVPENVRIIFYTLPGEKTYTSQDKISSNLCNDNYEDVTYASEPGDSSPEHLLGTSEKVYEGGKLIPPFVYFCNEGNAFNLKEFSLELKVTGETTFLSHFVTSLSNIFPNFFLNIYMLVCNTTAPDVKRELTAYRRKLGVVSDLLEIEAKMAAMSIKSNARAIPFDEYRENRKKLRGLEDSDPAITPQELDKQLAKLSFGKCLLSKVKSVNDIIIYLKKL